MRLSLEQIHCVLEIDIKINQELQNVEILSVCRDTNDVTANSLFVCIKGQRFDGHDFANKAIEKGAVALLVSRIIPNITVPQLLVKDTVKALGKLAKAWRKTFKGKLIAITGSAGKTTLKECLAQMLASANKKVSCSILNYNNQIGLPLSILATDAKEDYWVMEAGISQPQDMDELGEILEPDMVIILNAGVGHTEGLGQKGVAWHKAQLLKYINKIDGLTQAFVCADYPNLVKEAKKLCENICLFSGNSQGEYASEVSCRAEYKGIITENIDNKELSKGKYLISYAQGSYEVHSPFCGGYGAENLSALAAMAHSIGMKEQNVINAVQSLHLPKQRFHMHNLGSWRVIDDSYNANVLSMQRMLEATVQQANGGPCYAVLGAMGELGDLADFEHENLGLEISQLPISHVFWKGPYAQNVKSGLMKGKFKGDFLIIDDKNELKNLWQQAKLSPGTVLIKGSRSNALESQVATILENIKTCSTNLRGENVI